MTARKSRKGSRRSHKNSASAIARWDRVAGGTTTLVVPYVGVVISTGVFAGQCSIELLWGNSSSVLYGVPLWLDYARIFTSCEVREIRVRFTPYANASVAIGQGCGLAGFFQTSDTSVVAPASSIISFREACADAKPFYAGRSYTGVWKPGPNSALRLPFATSNTVPAGTYECVQWGYYLEGNPAAASTLLGNLVFEFLLKFYRS
jgi:hypothetical protein